jgi:hypothetical protein
VLNILFHCFIRLSEQTNLRDFPEHETHSGFKKGEFCVKNLLRMFRTNSSVAPKQSARAWLLVMLVITGVVT